MNEATLHDENTIGTEELKGVIEREVEELLELNEGDYCYIPDYEAYYGKKRENLLDGDGILRMNDSYIVQATWKEGIIDGDVILWDTARKRVAAFFVVQEGIIKQRLDVNTKDTLPDLHSRRYASQGNQGITDCHTWKEALPQPAPRIALGKGVHSPMDRNEGAPVLSRFNYVVIPDNSEFFTGLTNFVEILIVGKNCITKLRDTLNFQLLQSLRELHVSHGSFSRVNGLVLSRLPRLTKVSIGLRCFASTEPGVGRKTCVLEANPLLQTVSVGQGSFPYWSVLHVRRAYNRRD